MPLCPLVLMEPGGADSPETRTRWCSGICNIAPCQSQFPWQPLERACVHLVSVCWDFIKQFQKRPTVTMIFKNVYSDVLTSSSRRDSLVTRMEAAFCRASCGSSLTSTWAVEVTSGQVWSDTRTSRRYEPGGVPSLTLSWPELWFRLNNLRERKRESYFKGFLFQVRIFLFCSPVKLHRRHLSIAGAHLLLPSTRGTC